MEKIIEDKIKYAAKLLANSLMPDEYKDTIVDLVEKMTEKDLDILIESLEREKEELEKIEKMLKDIDKEQEQKWQKIVSNQEQKAKEMEDKFLLDIVRNKMSE